MKAEQLRYALSSVELYRMGALEELPYRLSDPLDLAIWCALQSYVDYLEILDLEDANRKQPNIYAGMNAGRLSARATVILEMYMNELKSWDRSEKEMTREGLHQTALYVLEALFAPARELSGRAAPWGIGEYSVPRIFWEAGEKTLEEREGNEGDEDHDRLTLLAHEPPIRVPDRLAPLFALLIRALGKFVTQSEAARRFGLTPRSVAARVERGELRHLRVGGQVLIPEEDVGKESEERLLK